MSDPDGPNPIDIYRKVLADVKKAGVDPDQAEELADVISVDLLEDLRPRGDDQKATDGSATALALEQLQAMAEALEEDRARLEWTAAQVAHLVDRRGKPSIDPDPTPQGLVAPIAPAPAQTPKEEAAAPEGDEVTAPSDEEPAIPAYAAASPSPVSNGSSPVTPATSTAATETSEAPESYESSESSESSQDDDPAVASPIPERLPIRRSYSHRRRRAWSTLLCVLVLVVSTVLLFMATGAG